MDLRILNLDVLVRIATFDELCALWTEAHTCGEVTLMRAIAAEQHRRFFEALVDAGATAEEVSELESAAERIDEAIGAALLTARAVDEV